ncbi:MAG: BrnT family toxin [Lachnospiraceae bacterium]|nr:BrnT family toxin [Lachnospiraceae bacterium]MBQ4275422.1 BrnT family toxin [Lachnospiraceae bacterium]
MFLFEWDERKNRTNQEKHGVSFEEARTVFFDDEALLITDPDHSEDEERFIILGFSFEGNVLVVVHCYRANDSIIRIISARKATRTEIKQYNERLER